MAERQIRHVEDVFSGKVGGKDVPKSNNMLDRKTSFNMFKNKQAPKPPSGATPLPMIGNYKPKILLQSPSSEQPRPVESERTVKAQVHEPPIELSAKPYVIGDKNVPLQIESNNDNDDVPVPAPRRKRRAPNAPEDSTESLNGDQTPRAHSFERSVSQRSDEIGFDLNFEEQGGDIDFAGGIDNPSFNSRARKVSSSSSRHRHESSSSRTETKTEHAPRRDPGITYPYIPPPDYDDEELTMMFEDEEYGEPAIDYNTTKRNSSSHHHMYKEYEGEDFGRYMQEEDYEFDAPRRIPIPSPNGRQYVRKAKAPPKPPKSNKSDKKNSKSKKKHEKDMKRNTIRDFTFSDSKIGWGDRTVKSTSAKGRYIKHNKDRKRVDNPQMFGNDSGTGSYEEFLRIKNGIPLESPNSSDSGVDIGEDKQNMDMYLHSQPKQMRYGKGEQKPSMWQRLTWKFRKSVNITRTESERL